MSVHQHSSHTHKQPPEVCPLLLSLYQACFRLWDPIYPQVDNIRPVLAQMRRLGPRCTHLALQINRLEATTRSLGNKTIALGENEQVEIGGLNDNS